MEPERIANKILTFQGSGKTRVLWVKEFHQDLEKCGIMEEDIGNKEVLRRKIAELKYQSDGKSKRTKWVFWKKNNQERSRERKNVAKKKRILEGEESCVISTH